MSTFQVQPGTPYNISIGEPGVAGTPSPTITYAWTYNGVAIGGNSRFVNAYTFPSLPGTLACTITLTNIVDSVSATVTASIAQASNLPTLSPITIRNNAAPTVPISTIANGNAGVVLRVGGPNAPDLNPVSVNASSIAYQWRRGTTNIANQTSQTYTMVEADEDETLTCIVTASNPDGSVARVASVLVGASLPNAKSHIGSHTNNSSYVDSGVPFANLVYNSFKNPRDFVHGLNDQGINQFGELRFNNWTGPPYYTADGWPFRGDAGALSESYRVVAPIAWKEFERMWSILGLTGSIDSPPELFPHPDRGDRIIFTEPTGIAGRSVEYEVTCYWEGQGLAVAGVGIPIPAVDRTLGTVNFTGPDGLGPFGDGPRTMNFSRVTGRSLQSLVLYILGSDVTGVDPCRNIVMLISNVRDFNTKEPIYAGFDHTTYKPFQLYPAFIESLKHCSHIRSLQNDYARTTPTADMIIHSDTGLEYEWPLAEQGSTHLLRTGWGRDAPEAPGFEKGFAAINRPTNVGFGQSVRAYIEICNQLNADLWWCHPAPTVFVGTRAQNGDITYARLRGWDLNDPNTTGIILADEDYVNGFADEIDQHLKPGLKVYSEWVNEVWNQFPYDYYVWATRYAWSCAERAKAQVEYGGDGKLYYAFRTLESPAIHAGTPIDGDSNHAAAGFSSAAGAKLAEGIRARLGSGSSREIVCVHAGQSNWFGRSSHGLGQLFAAMPKLFKQLDAVAHAPYRSWWFSSTAWDEQLVELGADGAWQYNAEVKGTQRSYANFPSLSLRSDSWWSTEAGNYPLLLSWKCLALDHPQAGGYQRLRTPVGWPANKRRWNLKLLAYEGGNHQEPFSPGAKLESYWGTVHPSYKTFIIRYMETVFAHGPKGLARDPIDASESEFYRPGMVPLGVVENAEPLHDRFTFLSSILAPQYNIGLKAAIWANQWWNGHDSPQAEGVKAAVTLGIGEPDWWLTYTGDAQ